MASSDPQPKTADRLRADIDRGLTGEKVPGSDPAAAPMGTDAEAGGAPPTRPEIELEARSRPTPATEKPRGRRAWLWGAGLLVLLLLIVVVVGAA